MTCTCPADYMHQPDCEDRQSEREPEQWPLVRVQSSARRGRPVRYGYVITESDGNSWVSDYRWHSAEAARRAGEVDADA